MDEHFFIWERVLHHLLAPDQDQQPDQQQAQEQAQRTNVEDHERFRNGARGRLSFNASKYACVVALFDVSYEDLAHPWSWVGLVEGNHMYTYTTDGTEEDLVLDTDHPDVERMDLSQRMLEFTRLKTVVRTLFLVSKTVRTHVQECLLLTASAVGVVPRVLATLDAYYGVLKWGAVWVPEVDEAFIETVRNRRQTLATHVKGYSEEFMDAVTQRRPPPLQGTPFDEDQVELAQNELEYLHIYDIELDFLLARKTYICERRLAMLRTFLSFVAPAAAPAAAVQRPVHPVHQVDETVCLRSFLPLTVAAGAAVAAEYEYEYAYVQLHRRPARSVLAVDVSSSPDLFAYTIAHVLGGARSVDRL